MRKIAVSGAVRTRRRRRVRGRQWHAGHRGLKEDTPEREGGKGQRKGKRSTRSFRGVRRSSAN